MGVPMGLGRRLGTASLGPWCVTQRSVRWSAAGWGCVLSEERWRAEASLPSPFLTISARQLLRVGAPACGGCWSPVLLRTYSTALF